MSRLCAKRLEGERFELKVSDPRFPVALKSLARVPETLYVMGSPEALQEGLAVVGARRATPYGCSCAQRFASAAAEKGIAIISGGARGCDSVAHEAALAAGSRTVAFLGGGLDELYPAENVTLFQRIINAGGALVSEHEWGFKPMPFTFRERNRLIAGLARATLIVEAGLPSGTFSTADAALSLGKEVLVVPGAITSECSKGANRLIYQGATPIVDDDSFSDALLNIFGCLKYPDCGLPTVDDLHSQEGDSSLSDEEQARRALLAAVKAEPLGMEALRDIAVTFLGADKSITWLMVQLAKMQRDGFIAQYPDGRYGPYVSG